MSERYSRVSTNLGAHEVLKQVSSVLLFPGWNIGCLIKGACLACNRAESEKVTAEIDKNKSVASLVVFIINPIEKCGSINNWLKRVCLKLNCLKLHCFKLHRSVIQKNRQVVKETLIVRGRYLGLFLQSLNRYSVFYLLN